LGLSQAIRKNSDLKHPAKEKVRKNTDFSILDICTSPSNKPLLGPIQQKKKQRRKTHYPNMKILSGNLVQEKQEGIRSNQEED
jgi:hypothetical protein